jgi:general secretion pathway protein K
MTVPLQIIRANNRRNVRCSPCFGNRHRGFALISVVLLLALLTLMATSAALLSVSHHRSASRLAETIELDARCDSALRLMMLRLIAPRTTADQIPIGEPVAVSLPGGGARVTIDRDAGKIDLNSAPPELLYALFAANGWNDEDARSMANRIADWRDPDDETRPGGAERSQYEAAGTHYGPRNQPFKSLSELRQVLGSERISADLLDAFTVYTHMTSPVERLAVGPVARAQR